MGEWLWIRQWSLCLPLVCINTNIQFFNWNWHWSRSPPGYPRWNDGTAGDRAKYHAASAQNPKQSFYLPETTWHTFNEFANSLKWGFIQLLLREEKLKREKDKPKMHQRKWRLEDPAIVNKYIVQRIAIVWQEKRSHVNSQTQPWGIQCGKWCEAYLGVWEIGLFTLRKGHSAPEQ